jgi:DNA-binding response OmpR family regulator
MVQSNRGDDWPCGRVLLIDDDLDTVETLRDALEFEGATVATATSPVEADRVLAAGFRPGVIVVDLWLRVGEGGEDYARRLRGSRYATTPIILMSADVFKLRRVTFEANAKVEKPFDLAGFLGLLRALCAGAPITPAAP